MGFAPPQNLFDWSKHTFFTFKPPWAPYRCRRQLEQFKGFYLPILSGRRFLNGRRRAIRMLATPINRCLSVLAWLRFKTNCFAFPIEASIFLAFEKLYSRVHHVQEESE